MSPVAELLHEASKLNRADRVELISALLEDLKSGKVKGLTEKEFWKACGRP